MNDPRTPADTNSAKRRQLLKRAKRGLIAGYIHELSGRHADPRKEPARRASEALRGG